MSYYHLVNLNNAQARWIIWSVTRTGVGVDATMDTLLRTGYYASSKSHMTYHEGDDTYKVVISTS